MNPTQLFNRVEWLRLLCHVPTQHLHAHGHTHGEGEKIQYAEHENDDPIRGAGSYQLFFSVVFLGDTIGGIKRADGSSND